MARARRGGRFVRALWWLGRRRACTGTGVGGPGRPNPVSKGARCGAGKAGAARERGGHGAGQPRRCHVTATCRPWRACSGARSPAALLLHFDQIDDARVRIEVGDPRVIDWMHLPARLYMNFVEFGLDSVELRMNTVPACKVFDTMHEPSSNLYFCNLFPQLTLHILMGIFGAKMEFI